MVDGSSYARCFILFYTIYKTTNLINGKFYIGKHKTNNLDDKYLGSGKLLIRAVKKHGIDNFVTVIILIYKTEREVNLAEKILVVCDTEVSYNLCPGGRGGFGYINSNKLADYSKAGKLGSQKSNWRLLLTRRPELEVKRLNRARVGLKKFFDSEIGIQNGIRRAANNLNTPEAVLKRKQTFSLRGTHRGKTNSQYGKIRTKEHKKNLSESGKRAWLIRRNKSKLSVED